MSKKTKVLTILAILVLALLFWALAARMARADEPAQLLNRCTGCDFAGVDWHGRNLPNVTLSGDDLESANLRGVNFRGARFEGVNLRNADLRDADLRGAAFEGTDLQGARFQGAKLDGSRFDGIDLRGTVLEQLDEKTVHALLMKCAGCDLRGVKLAGRNLQAVELPGSDLQEADLEGTDLQDAHLEGSDLRRARLAHANLRRSSVIGADAREADFQSTNFDGAAVCARNVTIYVNGRVNQNSISCIRLDGARFAGASVQHLRQCENNRPQKCHEIPAGTLEAYGHANLAGGRL